MRRQVTTHDPHRSVSVDATHWRRRLADLAGKHRVPGVTLGIQWLGEKSVVCSHGVLSKATGVAVTNDTLFQIGSIGKVWTATVAMQLVDEGMVDLDAPIVDVLPHMRLSDPDVTKQVTLRHLLSHTSGIGDFFLDTGRGDDCLQRYVDQLEEAGQTHPVGATFSYSNAGFSLIGRMIEKLTRSTWDAAMRERLFNPLGVTHTVTLPEEALAFRVAVGHWPRTSGADPEPTPFWVPRSTGPAGLIMASAADVLAFAMMHLRGGVAADGTRVLSEPSAAAMTEPQVVLPDRYTAGDSWGLSWALSEWDGNRLIGHDGQNTDGQSAFLRILPSQGLAVTLLTNVGNAHALYEDLYREIIADLASVAMPRPFEPGPTPKTVDASRHLGVYERDDARIEVFDEGGRLRMRNTVTGLLADHWPNPVQDFDLQPINETLFAACEPDPKTWAPVTFYSLPTGEPYLHCGLRASPKVS